MNLFSIPYEKSWLQKTVFQHLVKLSVLYALLFAIFENDFVFLSLFSSCCYRLCVRCFPDDKFLFWQNCFSGWWLTTLEDDKLILVLLTDFYRDWYLLWEWKTHFPQQIYQCREETGIYSVSKFTDSFEFLSSHLADFFGNIKLSPL